MVHQSLFILVYYLQLAFLRNDTTNEGNQEKHQEIEDLENRLSFNLATSFYNTTSTTRSKKIFVKLVREMITAFFIFWRLLEDFALKN